MRLLIDGYNLMHAAGLMKPRFGPGGLERARRAFIGVFCGSLTPEITAATVVFDARVTPLAAETHSESNLAAARGVQIEFATGPEGADARIEELIRHESTPRLLQVVSSDARIRTAAKHRGCRWADSDSFWEQLVERRRAEQPPRAPAPEKPPERTPAERDFWLHEFEDLIDPDDLRELAGPFAGESVDIDPDV